MINGKKDFLWAMSCNDDTLAKMSFVLLLHFFVTFQETVDKSVLEVLL